MSLRDRPRGALAGFDGLFVGGGNAVAAECRQGLGEQYGEGRAHLVAGIGGELLLLGKGGFEAREGGIKDGGKLAEFAFGFCGVDALREVARRNLHGGGTDFLDGPQGAGSNT